MRILFLSNYYPPYARGGYEQWCNEVAEELVTRGENVCVLTSKNHDKTIELSKNGVEVHRVLTLEVEQGLLKTIVRLLFARKRVEKDNLDRVRRLVTSFKPDVVLVWGMWNVPRSVPALLEQLLPNQVAYYICDYWLTLPSAYIQRWNEPAKRKWLNPAKRLLGKLFLSQLGRNSVNDLKLAYPICVSNAVKKLLVESHPSIANARVIYGGTNVSEFSSHNNLFPRQGKRDELKLLYVGRLETEKGVHTAIHALSLLSRFISDDQKNNAVTLDIIGKGDPIYIEDLRNIVEKYHIDDRVTFLESIPRSEIPRLMKKYDALIFPSTWPEPFARTVLEAMAAGLVVIGTTTGGTGELLINLDTGLTFSVGNPNELANQIYRIYKSPKLSLRLAKSGQEKVKAKFTFKTMVDQIQKSLEEILTV